MRLEARVYGVTALLFLRQLQRASISTVRATPTVSVTVSPSIETVKKRTARTPDFQYNLRITTMHLHDLNLHMYSTN